MFLKVTAIANFYVSHRGEESSATPTLLKTVKLSMCRGSVVSDLVIAALENANLAGLIGCTGVQYSSKKFKKYLDVGYNEKIKDGREYNIKAVWCSATVKKKYNESNSELTANGQKKRVTFPSNVFFDEPQEDTASCCTAVENFKIDSFFDETSPAIQLENTVKKTDTFVTAVGLDESAKKSKEVQRADISGSNKSQVADAVLKDIQKHESD